MHELQALFSKLRIRLGQLGGMHCQTLHTSPGGLLGADAICCCSCCSCSDHGSCAHNSCLSRLLKWRLSLLYRWDTNLCAATYRVTDRSIQQGQSLALCKADWTASWHESCWGFSFDSHCMALHQQISS